MSERACGHTTSSGFWWRKEERHLLIFYHRHLAWVLKLEGSEREFILFSQNLLFSQFPFWADSKEREWSTTNHSWKVVWAHDNITSPVFFCFSHRDILFWIEINQMLWSAFSSSRLYLALTHSRFQLMCFVELAININKAEKKHALFMHTCNHLLFCEKQEI